MKQFRVACLKGTAFQRLKDNLFWMCDTIDECFTIIFFLAYDLYGEVSCVRVNFVVLPVDTFVSEKAILIIKIIIIIIEVISLFGVRTLLVVFLAIVKSVIFLKLYLYTRPQCFICCWCSVLFLLTNRCLFYYHEYN